MSASIAPALVSSLADLVEYNVSDASAVQDNPSASYAERFIHSEIYKKYPDVNSVVHGHAEAVIPFGILNHNSVGLKPVYHMASIMGRDVPTFDIMSHYQSTDRRDMLVSNQRLGAALATEMMPPGLFSGLSKAVKSYFGTAPPPPPTFPTYPVILMRSHGFTCVGRSIEEAVYRSIYTQSNARILTNTSMLQAAVNQNNIYNRWRHEDKGPVTLEPYYLDSSGCKAFQEANLGDRSWKLWCREVSVNPLYRNDLGPPPGA